MALVKTQVSNLTVEEYTPPSQGATPVIRATWDYSKSTSGEYAYFKSFELTWKYSFGETTKKGTTVWYEQVESISSHSTTQTENRRDFTIPTVNPSKVSTISIYCIIKPTAGSKKVITVDEDGNEKETPVDPAWTGKAIKSNTVKYHPGDHVTVTTPSTPAVEVVKSSKKLKFTITDYGWKDQYARSVQFQTRVNGKSGTGRTYKKNIKSRTASITSANSLAAGKYYQVRAKGWSEENCKGEDSKWSSWSDKFYGPPPQPKGEWMLQVASRGSTTGLSSVANVILKDTSQKDPDNITIDGYEMQYTPRKQDYTEGRAPSVTEGFMSIEFDSNKDGGSDTTEWDVVKGKYLKFQAYFEIPEDISRLYYFRIRSKKDDQYSAWHNVILEYSFALTPNPPTIWFQKNTFREAENLQLFITNNSKDGSFLEEARIYPTVNGMTRPQPELEYFTYYPDYVDKDRNFDEPTYQYNFGTIHDLLSKMPLSGLDGVGKYDITVYATAKGLKGDNPGDDDYTETWSDASRTSKIIVWADPYVNLIGSDNGQWLWDPFNFLYDSISTAFDGTIFGDTVTHFPMFIAVESGPNPQEAMYYNFKITSNSEYDTLNYDGTPKHVSVGDILYNQNKNPSLNYETGNSDNYCLCRIDAWDISLENGMNYTLTVTAVMNSGLSATLVHEFSTNFTTATFEPDADIVLDNNNYSLTITPTLSEDMEYGDGEKELTLSDVVFHVFRRNYDDTMTNLITGLSGDSATGVIDPHPAMKGGLYRVVAMSKLTGEITYIDIPSSAFDEVGIMIQWNTEYQNYEMLSDDEYDLGDRNALMFGSGVGGSNLFLPYNIDTQNGYKMDAELVEYLGREHPVSYYGTQKGETLNLSTAIPKEGTEDIVLAMRRLSNYPGDVYIREPSGTGFWAKVEIQFNINHLEVIIPISITATRVEGGI